MKLNMNVDKLVALYGGPNEMSVYFTAKGWPMGRSVPMQWMKRGNVPMKAWLRICGIELKATGKRLDLWDFVKGANSTA